jgi:hypothetical protein
MFGLKLVAVAAILAQGALGDGIHLLNCRPFGGAGVSQTWLSIVAVSVFDSIVPRKSGTKHGFSFVVLRE